jgi:hypothetical protein
MYQIKLRGQRLGSLFAIELSPLDLQTGDVGTPDGFAGVSLAEWHERFSHCSQ